MQMLIEGCRHSTSAGTIPATPGVAHLDIAGANDDVVNTRQRLSLRCRHSYARVRQVGLPAAINSAIFGSRDHKAKPAFEADIGTGVSIGCHGSFGARLGGSALGAQI